jgi:hypothetical protein
MKQGRGGAGWRSISSPKGGLEGSLADHPGDGASKEGKAVRRYVVSVTRASGIETAKELYSRTRRLAIWKACRKPTVS